MLGKALEGVTIVEMGQAVAAPYCATQLAESGARVIKIERPGGDFARAYDDHLKGASVFFSWLNRGKESVELDIKTLKTQPYCIEFWTALMSLFKTSHPALPSVLDLDRKNCVPAIPA